MKNCKTFVSEEASYLLDEFNVRAEELLMVAPPDSVEEYFTLCLLWSRFKRLPSCGKSEFAERVENELKNLSDDQIIEAVNLFDANYWRENLVEATKMWRDEEVPVEVTIENMEGFVDDLDGFGACLAYASTRGLDTQFGDSRYEEFLSCCRLIETNEAVMEVIPDQITHMCELISDDLPTPIEFGVQFFVPLADQISVRKEKDIRTDSTNMFMWVSWK